MLVSNAFTKAIEDSFYDKSFTVASRSHTPDGEGGSTTAIGTPKAHKGNVQFSLAKRFVDLYGITSKIDLAITTSTQTVVKDDDEVVYNGTAYVVTSVKPRDSHLLIIGSKS